MDILKKEPEVVKPGTAHCSKCKRPRTPKRRLFKFRGFLVCKDCYNNQRKYMARLGAALHKIKETQSS